MKKIKFFVFIFLTFIYFGSVYYCSASQYPSPQQEAALSNQQVSYTVPVIGKYIFEVSIPGLAKKGDIFYFSENTNPFFFVVANFIQWGLRLSGVILFIVIVYSGVMYSLSGGDPKKKQEAQTRIIEALIGFFLLFGFYVILNTINPNILKQSLIVVTPNLTSPENNSDYAENPNQIPSSEPTQPIASGNYINVKDLGLPLSSELQRYPAVYLDSTLATQLAFLKGDSYKITDACVVLYSDGSCETTVTSRESNDCHRYGRCVDIDNTSSTTLEALRNDAVQNGLAVLDEGNHLHVTLPNVTVPPYWGGVDYSDCQSTDKKGNTYQWYVAGRCPK